MPYWPLRTQRWLLNDPLKPSRPAVLAAGKAQPAISHGRHNDFPKTEGTAVCPEIESVVISIPGVSVVAVIGLSDEKWGEIASAIVVADQSKVSEQQIVEFCGTRLARYKLPKKVIFAEAIPRNPSGKILKRVLREKYG
jgi:acyl-CoA synthetase (AMP-forming)/AMP-acid ligase II